VATVTVDFTGAHATSPKAAEMSARPGDHPLHMHKRAEQLVR
jgi:hypothetical protein